MPSNQDFGCPNNPSGWGELGEEWQSEDSANGAKLAQGRHIMQRHCLSTLLLRQNFVGNLNEIVAACDLGWQPRERTQVLDLPGKP